MSLPELVESNLGDEQTVAEVSLGGDDVLLVTPTRTLVYRAEGLLSDESVEEYGHDAERLEVSEGRRKASITLDYGLDGEQKFSIPAKRLDAVLHPVLAGVLNARGITDPGETVEQTFRFSELTLVVTNARLVKHIGAAVWDEDYDEFPYDDVTDLQFEEGNVATSVVLTVSGRQERFKAPNDRSREVREALTNAICEHYGVPDIESFRALSAEEEGEEPDSESPFGGGPDPLGADPSEDVTAENATRDEDSLGGARTVAEAVEGPENGNFGGSGFETAAAVDEGDDSDVAEEVAELRAAIERQQEQLEEQNELIEQLILELRQGR